MFFSKKLKNIITVFSGNKLKDITTIVLKDVAPVFHNIQFKMGQLPTGLRRDPYFLGWFFRTSGSLAKIASKNAISEAALGKVMENVGNDVFGFDVFDRILEFLKPTSHHHEEFMRGVRVAEKILGVMFGLDPNVKTTRDREEMLVLIANIGFLDIADDPDVIGAREEILADKSSVDASTLGGHLLSRLVEQHVYSTYSGT